MDFFKKIFGKQNTPEQTAPASTLTAQGDIAAENVVVGTQIIAQYLQSGGKQRDPKAVARGLKPYLESVSRQFTDPAAVAIPLCRTYG